MKTIAALLAFLTLLTACKRRTPSVPAPPAAPPASAVSEPAAKPAPAQTPMLPTGSRIMAGDQNLTALNTALKAYMAKNKKAPAKLDDLAKEGLVPFVPMAPPGMRYELDGARGEVKLVNPMVK